MTQTNDTIRVFIPLTQRRRNGRPRIVAPDPEPGFQTRSQDPHILRALGRAWAWRRKLESGEAATIHDIAMAEQVTDRYVSRIMRLAYLSPDVLERLVIWRDPPAVSVNDLIEATYLPWAEQMGKDFSLTTASSKVHKTGICCHSGSIFVS
jgi:hypothetical protein